MTIIQTPGGTWQRRFGDALMGSLSTPKVMLERGEGCQVWDVEGKRYLDFLAGIAVNALGHAHPALVSAIADQAAKLVHVSNYFATEPQLALAERLKRITGAGERGRVYFGNSGAEANEAAFKLARLNSDGGRRTRILALTNSFHGRTMGSLALTGKPALREPFLPMAPGVEHIDTSIEALEDAMGDDVAAIFVEPIKGEAGVLDLPHGYLELARELATEHGALLILDEIQTGVGRTGSWFTFQQFDVVPDAVLAEIERSGLVLNALVRGDQLRAAIEAMDSPLVDEIRGRGLLIGLGLTQPVAAEIAARCLEAGLIVNAPNDSSIRLAPPLIVGDAEIDEFTTIFGTVLKGLS